MAEENQDSEFEETEENLSDNEESEGPDVEDEDVDSGDVIILKDGEDLFEDSENLEEEFSEDKRKKPLIPPGLIEFLKSPKFKLAVAVAAAAIIFIIIYNLTHITKEEQVNPYEEADVIAKSLNEKDLIEQDLTLNSMEKLIAKATLLYEKGFRMKSLDLFNEIAIYNESLSWYNLGVARLKQKNYESAIEAFNKALNSNEHRCESALNAAVCSLILNKKRDFDYYIQTAYESLPDRADSPLYSYLYTVINHYKNRPLQVIVGSNQETDKKYQEYIHRVAAKSYLLLGDNHNAIKHLEISKTTDDLLPLGLLYAKVGNYEKAIERFKDAISLKADLNKAKEALILTYYKTGNLNEAGMQIKSMGEKKLELGRYPIEVRLKRRLFDIELAQEYFSKKLLLDNDVFLGSIFYFTPYQIMNPNKTMRLLQKGEMSIGIDDVNTAKSYLNDSITLSGVHGSMTLAAKLALNSRLIEANKIFKKLEKNYKFHDVLEYNLALSFAQLNDYKNAYKHFKRAYFLNYKNKMAGVFAVITSKYAGEKEDKTLQALMEYFQTKEDDESRFYLTLLNFYNDNILAFARWLESSKKDDPRYILLDIFTADKLERYSDLKEKTSKLKEMFPKELLSNILDIYADNRKYSIKQKAFGFQEFMINGKFDKESLFYGSPIIKNLYIKLGLLTGNLIKERTLFQKALAVEVNNPKGLMQGLALLDIYMGHFEEAFTIYNQLIDEQNVRDTQTLLEASVAAIGSGHKENAIALLELAIMQDDRNFEARYGLALLYHEIKNYDGAAVQLDNIDPGIYDSKYYDFDLFFEKSPVI